MEDSIRKFLQLGQAIRQLEEQVEALKNERAQIEQQVVSYISDLGEERVVVGLYEIYIKYRRQYEYDVIDIRNILEPRRLFDRVASVRVSNDRFTQLLGTPNLFSDAEFETLADSVHIISVKQVLGVKRNGR
jgi:hypothetical protein